ncbi:MAG: nitrate ABC transporter substrate-binding protein [Burkholderiaceae bacterium]|nr:MAG: nitrate ABC transporter substrate-binding protein [Burkholderiaceae bacterium]TAM09330.1 MAG: nitrate ABC transporter substrate-binding protein [Pusillimonas sp.]
MYRVLISVLTLAVSAAAFAAGQPNTTTVSIGLIPIGDVSPVYIGIKHGFFKQEGLDLKPTFAAGGAAIVPGVVSGSIDIGYSNTVSLITAAEKGLPLKIIAPGSQVGATQAQDHCFIYVKGSSAIKTVQDLAGKTIAVNAIKNLSDVTIDATLAAVGVNPSTVKYVEMPFPDMEVALQSGRVDATGPCEPFVTLASDAGQRRIVGFMVGTMPNLQFSAYFVSQRYAQKNPGIVKGFQKAMAKSLAYAQDHPDELRTVILGYTKISADVAKRMILPVWTDTKVNRDSLQRLSDLSVKYGIIPRAPDLDKLFDNG